MLSINISAKEVISIVCCPRANTRLVQVFRLISPADLSLLANFNPNSLCNISSVVGSGGQHHNLYGLHWVKVNTR